MRITSVLAIYLVAWNAATADSRAQERRDDVCYIQVQSFKLPFRVQDNKRDIREVRLHESADQGPTWKQIASAKPMEQQFTVNTRKDGLFWYAIQITDPEKAIPARLDRSTCDLKVIVDTVPPKVKLIASPALKGEVSVAWQISDDHLDHNATKLEYRRHPDGEWTQLEINPAAPKYSWRPQMMPIEVRLTARDFAGNHANATIRVPTADIKK